VLQAGLLTIMALVVMSRAGLVLPAWAAAAHWLIWVVVSLMGVGAALNLITPSARERRIWAPITLALFASSLLVALTAGK